MGQIVNTPSFLAMQNFFQFFWLIFYFQHFLQDFFNMLLNIFLNISKKRLHNLIDLF